MTIKGTAPSPDRLASGQELEVSFSDLLANGQAVGRAGTAVVFCAGPLPGERARVRITSVKPKYAVGALCELLDVSPDRTDPFCAVFGKCGGCQLQHLAYGAQLAWKTGVVRGALQRIGGFAAFEPALAIGMERTRAYRNKMSLVVNAAGYGSNLGFYRQRSHGVVPIHDCPVVMPELGRCIPPLDAAIGASPVLRDARHVVARASSRTGEVVLTFASRKPLSELAEIAGPLAEKIPGVRGIGNSYDPTGENAILGRKQRVAFGEDALTERIGEADYRVSSASFFQVNTEAVEKIFAHLAPLLHRPLNVVDLYCGVGTFALFFARLGATVFGIEENRHAVAEARSNATLNGVEQRATFLAGRVEDALASDQARAALSAAAVAFLDPPRKGSDEATLGTIVEAAVPRIWYLSCDPATLARDLKWVAAKGYRLDEVQPFDMFPQTGHVEALALLSRV